MAAILDFPLPVSSSLVVQHCHYPHSIVRPQKHLEVDICLGVFSPPRLGNERLKIISTIKVNKHYQVKTVKTVFNYVKNVITVIKLFLNILVINQ